jgi:glucosamine--fructose-6-phosphate aminotransferase (isomerizing)
MCGIIGYVGKNNAAPILLEGLKKLEYRGYDSCGMAILNQNNHIEIRKDIGKVQIVQDKLHFETMLGNIGVAHTRWATHGGVTKDNSHPHISNNKKIVVVHNGIIENFQEQREFLEKQGLKFYSQTDTEIIPNTIEYHMNKGYDFVDAVKKSVKHLQGQFAIVVLNEDSKKIIALRKEAPLVIGIGVDEYFVASDPIAFLDATKNVVFLKDHDMAIIDNTISFFNLEHNLEVQRDTVAIDWSADSAQKGLFDHYFMKEVTEQSESILRAKSIDNKIIKDFAKEINDAKGTFIVACGTAAHASIVATYFFSLISRKHLNFCVASEFPYFQKFLTKDSLIIAVSQSGETADTLSAIRSAKEANSKVLSITNSMGSTLTRESDRFILQNAGPEICVVSTKAYTSQLAILYLIAQELAANLSDAKEKLKEVSEYIHYQTSESEINKIKLLANQLKSNEHIYIIGKGLQYPTALEAALKIKETAYIHAEAYAGGELKHGTIALIEKGTPCIIFSSNATEKEIISNAMELKARGAYLIGVGPKNNAVFDYFLEVKEFDELNSIVQIVPIQILSYELALLRGCDPDKPRNLAKSVVVK